jgi:hypothetical protein
VLIDRLKVVTPVVPTTMLFNDSPEQPCVPWRHVPRSGASPGAKVEEARRLGNYLQGTSRPSGNEGGAGRRLPTDDD